MAQEDFTVYVVDDDESIRRALKWPLKAVCQREAILVSEVCEHEAACGVFENDPDRGVLVILPIYITLLLLVKTVAGVAALVSPVTAQLPSALQFREVIAVVILIFVCFVAGLLLRTGPGLRTKNAVELNLLDRIPGYALIRGLAARAAVRKEGETFAVALVEIEEALVPAFLIETHDDGAFMVFVPSVPTPVAGAIFILPKERVHLVDVPFTKAVTVISKWGAGARDLVKAMPPSNGSR